MTNKKPVIDDEERLDNIRKLFLMLSIDKDLKYTDLLEKLFPNWK